MRRDMKIDRYQDIPQVYQVYQELIVTAFCNMIR